MIREIWAKIINDARWYDGTPQGLILLTDHFEKQYNITERSAMCEANSNAVLADVRAALNSYDEMMRCGVITQVSGNEFQFSKYEDFKNSMEKLRVQISEHFS